MDHHTDWLRATNRRLGLRPVREDDLAKDARAVANAQTQRLRALRTELADLVADAESVLPVDADREDIVRTPALPALPDGFSHADLRAFEKSFATGMGEHMRAATRALRPLRDRLRSAHDPESQALAERVHAFIVAVHGESRA